VKSVWVNCTLTDLPVAWYDQQSLTRLKYWQCDAAAAAANDDYNDDDDDDDDDDACCCYQLNCQRAIDRRAPQNIDSLQTPFDASKFNFTRVKRDEILFELRTSFDDDDDDGNLPVSCVLYGLCVNVTRFCSLSE